MKNGTTPRKKRILLTVLGIILSVILILVLVISIIAGKNVKAMNRCVDAVLTELKENYTLTPRDVGDYQGLTVMGIMKFDVEQYDIEGIGNLSVMRMNMGLMQMATIVITPTDKNLPLLSADYMYILSNRKAYMEFYDLVAEKDEDYQKLLAALDEVHATYNHLEDIEVSEAWYAPLLTVTAYKGGSFSADQDLENILVDSLKVYEQYANEFPALSEEERAEKIALTIEYTDGLIEKGGISTDVFKKELGDETTKHFFDHVFFGTLAE